MSISVENSKGQFLVQWNFQMFRRGGKTKNTFQLEKFHTVRHFLVICIYKDIRLIDDRSCQTTIALRLTLLKTDLIENDPESVFNQERFGQPIEVRVQGCDLPLKLKRSSDLVWSSSSVSCKLPTCFNAPSNRRYLTKCGTLKMMITLEEFPLCTSERKTMDDVLKLYVDQIHCDVKFCFDGNDAVQIGGHKSILAARSTVFAAMFAHDTLEQQTNQINIPDFKPDIFDLLLFFIYSGRIKKRLNDTDVLSLYQAADKYDIGDLRKSCVDFLLPRIQTDNVLDVMTLADLHAVKNLKEAVTEFIAKHKKEMVQLKDWKKLSKDFPELGAAVTRQLSDDFDGLHPPRPFLVSLLVVVVRKLVTSTRSVLRNLSVIS